MQEKTSNFEEEHASNMQPVAFPKNPKISVITVSYNQGRFISENIESVLAQNYPNFEHIVIDGGSTDNTVEVLESYPHLIWASEKDRGQSDALNKGFAKATGDIIAWLNSDDWYPPNVFHEVAEALQDRSVIMGAAEETDINGVTQVHVPNIERTWFDILKYWVYFSVPGQPAIFFRREILEQVKLADGTYIDENLEFAMDYEFWLRVAKHHAFDKRSPNTFAYSRMYDENKTGQKMTAVYREISWAYERHCRALAPTDSRLSLLILSDKYPDTLPATLEMLRKQSLQDFEVVVADYANDMQASRKIRKQVIQLGESFQDITLRHLWSNAQTPMECLGEVVEKCCAPIISIFNPACTLEEDYCLKLSNIFRHTSKGILFPCKNDIERMDKFTTQIPEGRVFDMNALFNDTPFPMCFSARRVALIELAKTWKISSPFSSIQALLLRLLFKSWSIDFNPEIGIGFNEAENENTCIYSEALEPIAKAHLIVDMQDEMDAEPFAKVRADNGFLVPLPAELVEQARSALKA